MVDGSMANCWLDLVSIDDSSMIDFSLIDRSIDAVLATNRKPSMLCPVSKLAIYCDKSLKTECWADCPNMPHFAPEAVSEVDVHLGYPEMLSTQSQELCSGKEQQSFLLSRNMK